MALGRGRCGVKEVRALLDSLPGGGLNIAYEAEPRANTARRSGRISCVKSTSLELLLAFIPVLAAHVSPNVFSKRHLSRPPRSPKRRASAPDKGPVVVAIGASAGGVQALQALLSVLPEHTGASFVVI